MGSRERGTAVVRERQREEERQDGEDAQIANKAHISYTAYRALDMRAQGSKRHLRTSHGGA